MDLTVGLGLIKLIALIINVAHEAKICQNSCRSFAQYLELIGNLLEGIKNLELMQNPETRKPLELLKSVLRESYHLVDSCRTESFLDFLPIGRSVANKLKEKESEIDRYLKLIPLISLCYQEKLIERMKQDAVKSYQADCEEYRLLLAEVITVDAATNHFEDGENILTSWSEAKRLVATHERYKRMPKGEREKLLCEYVDGLHKRCVREYRELLDEVITLDVATKHFKDGENILTSWSEAKPLLATRQRYKRMPKGERNKLLCEYVEELHKRCVREYRELLAKVINLDWATKQLKNGKHRVALWSNAKDLLREHQRYVRMPQGEAKTLFHEYVKGSRR